MVNVFIDARMSVSPKERSSLWTFWRKDLSRKAMGPFHWLLLENMHEKDWYEYRAGPQDRFLTNVIHWFRHIGYLYTADLLIPVPPALVPTVPPGRAPISSQQPLVCPIAPGTRPAEF